MLPIEKTKELTDSEPILKCWGDDRETARLVQMREYTLDFGANAVGEC